MAAICCATGAYRRPDTISTRPKQSAKPATNAAAITRMRLLRAVISECLRLGRGSQAGGDPGDDHLVEDGRAVMGPERQRPGKHDPGERRDQHRRTRQQGYRCRGHRCARVRSSKSIGPYHIGLLAAADNRSQATRPYRLKCASLSTPLGDGVRSLAALPSRPEAGGSWFRQAHRPRRPVSPGLR